MNNKINSQATSKKIKTNLTNSKYQNKFLAVLQAAETEIKKLICFYALHLKSKIVLRSKIQGIIKGVAKLLPFSLYDRKSYLEGLYLTSEKMIKDFYDKIVSSYYLAFSLFVAYGVGKKVNTPAKMIHTIQTGYFTSGTKANYDLWSEAKGTPYVKNYYKLVTERIKKMAETQTVVPGKERQTFWQKAELDIRYESQVEMVDQLRESGVKYAWTSSHPDCSKRCEPWQGKLFDLDSPKSDLSGHRMKNKIDGNTVYCFQEVIHLHQYGKNGKDYGENSIIYGYNCRHRLIPYKPGSLAPKSYNKADIEKERAINTKLRSMERTIRLYKQKSVLYNGIDKKRAEYYRNAADVLTAKYKKYANDNGFAWYQDRIKI